MFPGIKGDTGLVLKSKAAHHAISTVFPEPIDPKGKPLVVQYEVKLQKGLECGGAYIKLLTEEGGAKALRDGAEYTDKTPFTIMFGPDKCGATNKVHFIFRHKNPITGEYEEKHYNHPPAPRISKTTALYTLIVNPDNTFQIKINDEVTAEGNLLEDFKPPVNPPKLIDDPEDTKPEDWVDDEMIEDVDAVKPDDWDEDAPLMIEDTEAVMPDDWLVDEPRDIPDPDAEKPEEWDDEEDGDWIPPTVPNPKCEEVSGCGPWTAPKIRNPDYKGKWVRPYKKNPAYKGAWAPRQIENPDWFEDPTPANLEPIGGVGIELWTMTEDILFDNIYIGTDPAEAKKFADETFHVKKPIEQAAEGSTPDDDEANLSLSDKVRLKIYEFADLVKETSLLDAAKALPEVAAGLTAALVTFLALLMGLMGLSGSKPAQAKVSAKKQPTVVKKKVTTTTTESPAGKVTAAKIEEIDSEGDVKVTQRAVKRD